MDKLKFSHILKKKNVGSSKMKISFLMLHICSFKKLDWFSFSFFNIYNEINYHVISEFKIVFFFFGLWVELEPE